MANERIAVRVRQLLEDAAFARESGSRDEVHALATAVLALDPGNEAAEELLDGLHQRSQMTLMFCDLADSTALADVRDPEEMGEILRGYRTTCTQVIERFGGFVEDRRGDGMLVRFGYPWVHEDDTRRAVTAGLEIVRAMRARNARHVADTTPDLHLRIAVHTGIVVLDGGEVVGAAPNEAARLQTLAAPDTVLISDTTQSLVSGYFDVESMGEVSLRGVSRPMEVFTVLGEHASARLDTAVPLTPFTGRDSEIADILDLWDETCAGAQEALRHHFGAGERVPVAVLVTGPGGIGKTRLAREAVDASGAPHLACRCSSYHQTTSLHPFRRALEAICSIATADSSAQRLAKLRTRLAAAGVRGADLPMLTAVLAIPAAETSPPTEVDPTKLRSVALHAAARLVCTHAAGRPMILVVEDLHWVDGTTLELISILLSTPDPGLLLLLTARPGFELPWPHERLARLELDRLAPAALEQIADTLAEGAPLQAGQRAALIERSAGIPLYLEELVRARAAVSHGPQPRTLREPDEGIPAALRDPLLARLVLPGIDLDLAQIAATIGGDVDRELLRRAAHLEDRPFQVKLANLVAAGLIDPAPDGAVRFHHELIREVAYQTQRGPTTRERHSRVADLLHEDGLPGPDDAVAVAFHLERAERYPEAVEAHMSVAREHQALGAHNETVAQLTHVLGLVDQLEGAAQLVGELTTRHMRSFSAIMAGGYSAPETAQDQARCVELCEQLGLTPEMLPSLIVSLSYYTFRGDLEEAERVCQTMREVVDETGGRLPASEFGMGVVSFFSGHLDEASTLMETFLAHPWSSPLGAPPSDWPLPNDPFAAISAHLLLARWLCGDPEGARALGDGALERVATLGFPYGPFSACYVHSQLAIVRRLEGDHAGAAAAAAEMIELGDRHGFGLWTLAGAIQATLTQVHLGDHTALATLAVVVGQWRELLSAELWTPYWLTELAGAQRVAGELEAARVSLDEALAVAVATGSDFYSAETLRLRGELRCRAGDREGLVDLERAIDKARVQHATALELRARASLELEARTMVVS